MPKHVMVALLSDQPRPNIIATLQYEPRPTHIEFIVSADKGDVTRYDERYETGQVILKNSDIELDAVLTRNASLAICEAKMGAKLSITMSKLRAQQEAMAGVYGKTFYLTAAEQVTADMRATARVYGVSRIITANELSDISGIIAKAL